MKKAPISDLAHKKDIPAEALMSVGTPEMGFRLGYLMQLAQEVRKDFKALLKDVVDDLVSEFGRKKAEVTLWAALEGYLPWDSRIEVARYSFGTRLTSLGLLAAPVALTACGGGGGSSGGGETNTAPVANADAETTLYGKEITIDVVANDTDAEGHQLTVKSVSIVEPAHGTATIVANKVVYKPNAGFVGKERLKYIVSDGRAEDTGEVEVTVAPNQYPYASDDTATTQFDTPVEVNVFQNDGDLETPELMNVESFTQPANGRVQDLGNGRLKYIPNPGFSGYDHFTYMVSDGQGGTREATVHIYVGVAPNNAPNAVNDTAATDYMTSVTIDVDDNDTDPDGDARTITAVGTPQNGSAELTADGKIKYTPRAGFSGRDTFTYAISDGKGGTDVATVTVEVAPNLAPTVVNDGAATQINTAVGVDVLANDTDQNNQSLSIHSFTQPANGIVVKVGNILRYTPNNGFVGTDTFTYTATDGHGGTSTAVVTINVKDQPNTAPVAVNDFTATAYEKAVTANVLGNDYDINGDQLTIAGISQPAHGLATVQGGSIKYTPDAGFSGTDVISYTISDGKGGTAQATLSITVAPNKPPNAVNDNATTQMNSPVNISVLGNDSDDDGGTLSVASHTQPANGTVTNLGSGILRYKPKDGYVGADEFTYIANDGQGGTKTATVFINVEALPNQPPIGMDDNIVMQKNTSFTKNVLGNDSDPNGDAITISSFTHGANGTVDDLGDGKLRYNPNPNWTGTDSFTYTIFDGKGGYDTATVFVTVEAPPNQPPIAEDLFKTTVAGVSVTFSGLEGASDSDGGTLSIVGATNGAHGSVTNMGGGNVKYKPTAGYFGPDSFTITISDGQGGTVTRTVYVNNT